MARRLGEIYKNDLAHLGKLMNNILLKDVHVITITKTKMIRNMPLHVYDYLTLKNHTKSKWSENEFKYFMMSTLAVKHISRMVKNAMT